MNELIAQALAHFQRKFDVTKVLHNAVLAIAQASGAARLIIGNPTGHGTQTVDGGLTITNGVLTGDGSGLINIAGSGGMDDFAYNAAGSSALNYAYKAGKLLAGTTVVTVNAATVALTNNATNYIEVDSSGTVSANIVGFTAGRWAMAIAITSGGAITGTPTDKRAFATLPSGGAMSTPQLVTADAGTGNATYTLLTDGITEFVWKSGALQAAGVDYTRSGQKITFLTGKIPNASLGDYVMVSSAINLYAGAAAGGAMSSPAIITADAATGNATFTIPGSGLNEFVWKGGALQFLGLDYTKVGNKITFVAGKIPPTTTPVAISAAITPMTNSDAVTFSGHAFSEFVLKTAAGGLQIVADTTAAAALTGLSTGAMVMIQDLGLFRYSSTATDTADGETCLTVTAGGRLFIELMHPDGIFAVIEPRLADLQYQVDSINVRSGVRAYYNGGSYSSPVTTPTKVPFNVTEQDDMGDFDVVNNRFVARKADWHAVSASIKIQPSGPVVAQFLLKLYKNGVFYADFGSLVLDNATQLAAPVPLTGATDIYLLPGDYIEIFHVNGSSSMANAVAAGTAQTCFVTIKSR